MSGFSMGVPAYDPMQPPVAPGFNLAGIGGYGSTGAQDPLGAAMRTAGNPGTAGVGAGSLSLEGATLAPNVTAQTILGNKGMGDNVDKVDTGEIGMNIPTLKLGLGAVQTLGNLWSAYQMQSLAKEQFAFQKDITNTNLNNSIQNYNTTLQDRIRARTYAETGQEGGMTAESAKEYLSKNELKRRQP